MTLHRLGFFIVFFFKQKTAYEIRPCDWSSDVCSSDLRTDNQKGAWIPFAKSQATAYLPRGFAQMTILDASNFNRRTYNFDYVRREFLGDVRCLVFDVAPIDKPVAGQFVGSIWVEDKDYRI